MTNLLSVSLVVLAMPLSAFAQDKDAPSRHIDETPFGKEPPKPAPAGAVVDQHARIAAFDVNVAARPVQWRMAGDPESITIELPVLEGGDAQRLATGLMRFDRQNSPIASENFDLWLFGRGSNEKARRKKLDILLGALAENAAWRDRLSDQERVKLVLAGKGDIKRLFDRVGAERLDFEEVRADFAKGREALLRIKLVSVEMEAGPFGDGSLFAKMLAKIEKDKESGAAK
jgi:hypothetical protein